MKPTLRVHDPKEILSLIPFQLGFVPEKSVVFVSLRGPRRQVGLVARVDVEDFVSEHSQEILEQLGAHCRNDGARSVLVIGYQDGQGARHVDSTLLEAFRNVQHHGLGGLRADEFLVVQHDVYGHVAFSGGCSHSNELSSNWDACAEAELCSEHAGNTADFANTEISAHMVYQGRSAVKQRSQLAYVERSSQSDYEVAQAAYLEASQSVKTLDIEARNGWRAEMLQLWVSLIDDQDSPMSPQLKGEFIRFLEDIPSRDSVLISCSRNGAIRAKNFINGYCDSAINRDEIDAIARLAISEITDRKLGLEPDRARVLRISELLSQLVAVADTSQQMAPRTLLALLAWWEGNGALARRHLEEMRQGRNDYSLAQLVTTALDCGLAPGWQRSGI